MTVRRGIVAALVAMVFLVALWTMLWLVPLAQQDSAGTVFQAAKMALAGDNLAVLSQDDEPTGKWLLRGDDGFNELVLLLEEEGLVYVEQMGAGRMFDDNGERVVVNCVAFTTRFLLCTR